MSFRSSRTATVICMLVSAAAAQGVLRGDTIASTFGPGDSFDASGGWAAVAPYALAYPFRVPDDSNYLFIAAKLAISWEYGPTNEFDAILANDHSNQPGTGLESFHLVNVVPPIGGGRNNAPVEVESILNPLLVAGGQYWLIAAASVTGNGVSWESANILPVPPEQGVWNGDSWHVGIQTPGTTLVAPGAFSIAADPVASVPEPSSFLLMLGSIAGLVAFRRRRERT